MSLCRFAVIWFAWLSLGVAAGAATPTPITVDRNSVALGEPLQLRLTRALRPGGPTLDGADLSALQHDFEVVERTLGRDSTQESLTLTLYPRRVGRFDLPALGQPGRAPRITVTDGSASVSRVQWQLGVEPAQPLVRQPVTFTLEACDDGSLLWKRPALPSVEGLLVRPLNETEIITTRNGQRCTAHRWHWTLLPTADGELQLPLPVLEASKFGQRLRFVPPSLTLRAEPLPAWLPAEVAVGQPEFAAEPLPAQAALEQPLAWRLRVSGAYSAQALQSLLALQLRAADERLGLEHYALQVEPQPATTAAPPYRVTLYLVPRVRGRLALPELQLPWYDPASGQVMQRRLPSLAIEVVDPQRERWQRAGIVLAGLLAATLVGAWFWRAGAWRVRRWRMLRRVQRAPDVQRLCAELLAYRPCRPARPAATLGDWQHAWSPHADQALLHGLVQALERARFGASKAVDLQTLRQLAQAAVRQLRPS